jgi:ArsR family transcriptional regulator
MADLVETLKLLADRTRLRLLCLIHLEELSVAELQAILDMGQSRISSHLSLLRQAGLVDDRREGKRTYYSGIKPADPAQRDLLAASLTAAGHLDEVRLDQVNLERALARRRAASEQYFNAIAGRLGRHYCPGRSWQAIGHFLLHLTPAIDIADLGAGEGMISLLLARRARHVWCIDSSPAMVEVGSRLASEHGIDNLEYKLGEIEHVPLADASVDLALLSQALHHAQKPSQALREAHRILRPGGQIIILDLNRHNFEKARELYADQWLGFPPNRLYAWLRDIGFRKVGVEVVAREEREPHFETILASGVKE